MAGATVEETTFEDVNMCISTVLLWLGDAIRHCFLMLALLRHRGEHERKEISSKAPSAVAKSTEQLPS